MKNSRLIVLMFFTLLLACSQHNDTLPGGADGKLRIKTATVSRADMADTVRFYGRVSLRYESLLASQFDGRLSGFSLLPGDQVAKEQKIGEIIPPQREALLQVLPQMDARLRPLLLKQIKTIPLTSPLAGSVLKVFRHNGDVLQKGEAIVHIGDLSILDVYGDLPLKALPQARHLKEIQVHFIDFPHPDMALKVAAVAGGVDRQKQTVAIRLTLPNPDGLFRPGMIVRMFFPGERHRNVLTIPRIALLEHEGLYSAFVVKNNIVEERVLKIGIKDDRRIEVLAGLKEGERVATQKAYSLTDGMEVVVE
ncbi:efflux RND transporter periplasmic adaptor subunit [Caldithrix abyssi]